MIRPANLSDLDALVQLETRNFDSDRLSRRSFYYLLTRGNAILLVDVERDALRGYALLRFHARSPNARLYSIAIEHTHRSRGIGRALLTAAEKTSRKHGAVKLRLEVREDNHVATRWYLKLGYRQFGKYLDYYADHADALRMQKSLAQPAPRRAQPTRQAARSAA
ncbi:MAG: N-acetyltransferase [Gammaproteobacteria bacterium]